MLANDGMSVYFRLIIRQADMAAVGITICQLCRLDEHCSVTKQHEVTSRRAVIDVVAPDIPRLRVLLTVRRHTAHGDVMVLSHVPHYITYEHRNIAISSFNQTMITCTKRTKKEKQRIRMLILALRNCFVDNKVAHSWSVRL